MFGSFIGNICGIGYFMSYQILGILAALLIFRKEKTAVTVFIGSVMGSFALQWLPVLYAFFLDFGRRAHIAALLTMVALVFVVWQKSPKGALTGRTFTWNIKNIILSNIALRSNVFLTYILFKVPASSLVFFLMAHEAGFIYFLIIFGSRLLTSFLTAFIDLIIKALTGKDDVETKLKLVGRNANGTTYAELPNAWRSLNNGRK